MFVVAGLAENRRGCEAMIAWSSLGFPFSCVLGFAGFRVYPKIESCTVVSSVSRRDLHALGAMRISD